MAQAGHGLLLLPGQHHSAVHEQGADSTDICFNDIRIMTHASGARHQ